MNSLPPELLLQITTHLPLPTLASLTLVSPTFHSLLSPLLHRRILNNHSLRFRIRTASGTIEGNTLQWASFQGDEELVLELLEAGWDADEAVNGGVSPLCLAVEKGDEGTVRTLMAYGAAVMKEEAVERGIEGWVSPMRFSGRLPVVGWVAWEMLERMKEE